MAEKEKNNKKGKASNTTSKKAEGSKVTTKKSTTSKKTESSKAATKKSATSKKTVSSKKDNVNKKNNTQKKNEAVKTTNTKKPVKKNTKAENANIKEEDKEVEKESKIEKEKKANLKQARKQLYYSNNAEPDEFSKLIKIVLIVTAIIVVFYGVTVVVTEKASEATKEANKEEAEIQYDSIMIGSMLNINGSFYVLIEDADDIRLSEYTTMIQTIKANDDAPTIYTADLSSGFNASYLSDKSSYDSNMESFKVTGTTLVRIEDHEIQDVYDNYDDIIDKLNELD